MVIASNFTNQMMANVSTTSELPEITTSTDIYSTFDDTNLSALGANTNVSDSQCVIITEGFSWSLNGIWTETDTINEREAYIMDYGFYGHAVMYLYWDNDYESWNMAPNTSAYWYWCEQYDLNACTEGFWHDTSGESHNNWIDDDATLRAEGECSTPSPTNASNFTNEMMVNLSTTSEFPEIATSTDIYTTFDDTNLSATGSNINVSDSQCIIITEGFSWGLNGTWTETDTINEREAYSMEYDGRFPMMYIYWDSEYSDWNIAPNISDYWYWCEQYDLHDCTEGFWHVYGGDSGNNATLRFEGECPTPSPTIADCTPYVATLNFYDAKMDGIWLWSDEHQEYRLNISGSAGYYKMYQQDSYWDIYEVHSNGEMSDYLSTYCDLGDIAECAGQWIVWDYSISDSSGSWIYDSAATSQLVDCTPSECDVIWLSGEETDCMFFTKLQYIFTFDVLVPN